VLRPPAARTLLAVAVFLAYAINFLYFFVDDEAITLVYARNLLRGRGLSYSAFEGATEGYSNFLHVCLNAVLLGLTHVAGWPTLTVFALGIAVSLLSGAAIIALTARLIRRLIPGDRLSEVGALAFLALAGPLAVWSCSSLETVPSAAAATGFVVALLLRSEAGLRWALPLGAAVLLFRIDGFVFVGIAAVAVYVAERDRRRDLVRALWPLTVVFVVYNGWRWWYFGSLLSLPLQTKVLFKLLDADGLVSRLPDQHYLEHFLDAYPPVPLLLLALGWLPFWRPGDDRRPFALLLIALGFGAYASVIGDWMFGFRFFVVVLPAVAMLAAVSLSAVRRWAPRVAVACVVMLSAWTLWSAQRFITRFEKADRLAGWRSWWSDPSRDPARYFAPYYPMYRDLRGQLEPGSVTINNQAGFLPFMLDLENIDDLGIASRFFAALPTADVIFTEIGRYHPLTSRRALSAGEVYLTHRDARYLVIWTHMLANANSGHVPTTLLDGHFQLRQRSAHQLLYERARPPAVVAQRDFLENLAHPGNVEFAALKGRRLADDQVLESLPFLTGETARYAATEPVRVELHLPGDPVYRLWIDGIESSHGATLIVTMHDERGVQSFRDRMEIAPGQSTRYDRLLEAPVNGAVFTLDVVPTGSGGGTLTLRDVRVLGQSPELRDHLEKELSIGH